MTDFLNACVASPVNLVLSVLLCVTALYWVVVILGAVGMDSLDFDLDAGDAGDAGLDGDVSGHGFLGDSLEFLHVGKVPVLILWSVLVCSLWGIGVLTWPVFGGWGLIFQLLFFVPVFVVSLLVMKVATLPVAKTLKRLEADSEAEANVKLIGRRGTVVSLTVDTRSGQVEIPTAGAPLKLHARTRDESTVLNKGDEAVIVAEDENDPVYYVTGF